MKKTIGFLLIFGLSVSGFGRSIDTGIWDLTSQIVSRMHHAKLKSLAILPFYEVGGKRRKASEIGTFISEELITSLSKKEFLTLVERSQLAGILNEQKLSLSGMIDSSTLKEIGELKSADVICMGNVTRLSTGIKINLRLINVETGNILGTASTRIDDPGLARFSKKWKDQRATLYIDRFDHTSLGSMPLTRTLSPNDLSYKFVVYNEGIGMQVSYGIFNSVSIGLSENINHLVGSGSPYFFLPGLHLKWAMVDEVGNFSWTHGFDVFELGETSTNNNVHFSSQGLYSVIGMNLRVFSKRDQISIGYRFPILPTDTISVSNSSLFTGIHFGIGDVLTVGASIEDIFVSFSRLNEVKPSLIFSLTPSSFMDISVILNYQNGNFTRLLTVEYQFNLQ